MANSMPFNSINADRPYKAEDWAWYFGTFIGNGVFPKPETGLQVVANEGMKITVNEGKAFINGYAFKNPSNYEMTLDTADGALARIDRVVVRWDLANRDMYIDVLKGTVSANPKAADVTRNSEVYELALADITVSKGVTSITQAYITDQRFNTSVCGIVKGTVEEIDASVLTAQFEDFINTYQEEKLAEFEEWVESIKDVLDENAAGNLQLQIDEHIEKEVPSENGAHGFRYFEGRMQAHIYDEESQTLKWVNVPYAIDENLSMLENAVGFTKKNVLNNNLTTQTVNGIKYTINADKSITVSGTATADSNIRIDVVAGKDGIEIGNKYILSGKPKDVNNGCSMYLVNSTVNFKAEDFGDGVEFIFPDKDTIFFVIFVNSGTTVNATFYPMIRDARIEDSTYEPCVPSVQTRLNNIQVGLEALTGLTAGGTTTRTIKFPRAFADKPQCFVELGTSSFDADVRVTNTSATEMTISVKLPSTMTSLYVRWLAIL